MFKNCESIIKKYTIVCTVISFILCSFSGLIGLIGIFLDGEEEAFLLLIFSILLGLMSWVIGAFLSGFADIIENVKLQSELLLNIRKKLSNENCNEVTKNEM